MQKNILFNDIVNKKEKGGENCEKNIKNYGVNANYWNYTININRMCKR